MIDRTCLGSESENLPVSYLSVTGIKTGGHRREQQSRTTMDGMRGDDHQPDSMFSHVSAEQRVPLDHPLRAIRAVVDDVRVSRPNARMCEG
jgi:hypothetical protein